MSRLTIQERFWQKVDKSGDCWLWTGTKSDSGYGRIHHNGRGITAHRLSYELVVGPIPDGLFALHRCDVRLCVRPDHLFIGTALDNSRDCIAKGRDRYAVGEDAANSKLTTEQVREIRRLRRETNVSIAALARKYGVHWVTIKCIDSRKTWLHVD